MIYEIRNSLEKLSTGGLFLYPTDTVWGIGCDATNQNAVQKIFDLKQREESKSLVILVSDIEMLKETVESISAKALQIIQDSKNPTTIIYHNPIGLAQNTIANDNTIAIRIPNHKFCCQLIKEFGKPIVSTSANISGNPTPKSFQEIETPILEGVDYVVNLEREKISHKSSTILKINGDELITIRA